MIAAKAKSERKQFLKYVKSKINNVTNIVKDDGSITKTDLDKAEVLNGFFASVFTQEKYK